MKRSLLVTAGVLAALASATPAAADPYLVRRGDTLTAIAAKSGTSVADLLARNKLRDANMIREGQMLDVPGAPAPANSPTGGNPAPALPLPIATYTVQAGDTILRIAKRVHVAPKDLVHANKIADPNKVRAGTVLLVPNPTMPPDVTARYPAEILSTPERLALISVFDAAAKEFNVPPDLLKATCWIESAWIANAQSDKGAIGIGQLMPATSLWLARDMMNEPKLDPLVPGDNIRMSARMLRWLLDQTNGNLTVTMQGYYQGLRSVLDHGASPTAKAYATLVLAARPRFA